MHSLAVITTIHRSFNFLSKLIVRTCWISRLRYYRKWRNESFVCVRHWPATSQKGFTENQVPHPSIETEITKQKEIPMPNNISKKKICIEQKTRKEVGNALVDTQLDPIVQLSEFSVKEMKQENYSKDKTPLLLLAAPNFDDMISEEVHPVEQSTKSPQKSDSISKIQATQSKQVRTDTNVEKSDDEIIWVVCFQSQKNSAWLYSHIKRKHTIQYEEMKTKNCKDCRIQFNKFTDINLHIFEVHMQLLMATDQKIQEATSKKQAEVAKSDGIQITETKIKKLNRRRHMRGHRPALKKVISAQNTAGQNGFESVSQTQQANQIKNEDMKSHIAKDHLPVESFE